jgi:hypothetical protein
MTTIFSKLRIGDAFQFEANGPVWVKCRGGFRPGRGGQLHACAPHQAVIVAADSKPEGVLRSSFLPLDVKAGTKLFLSYENGWYRVHTRFENYKRSRTLDPAATYYEDILAGKVRI